MIIFYKKSDNSILSYVSYTLNKLSGGVITNLPSKELCASRNGLQESDIGIAEFLIENPDPDTDFKDNLNNLGTGDYDIID